MHSWRNEAFGKIHKFWSCESEQCKNLTALGFATSPSLNLSKRLPIGSNHDENYYRWQHMMNGQCIEMSVNGASTIGGFVRRVIKKTWSLWCITDILAAFITKRDSDMLPAASWEWVWTERPRFLASDLGKFMFQFVVDIHLSDIDSFYWE